ncbi:DUF202 domain-containing protein [Mycobacterium simulans]|uniref:DUF202 domain-containing protein n=1 Tax=Mycobacterium simulans TaxID=627089 RepID=UPI00163FBE15
MINEQTGLADAGLQAERTTLSWSRTTLAVTAVSGFVARENCQGPTGGIGLFAAGLAVVAAVFASLVTVRREHTLNRCPHRQHSTPRCEVALVGASIVALWLGACPLVLLRV